MKQAPSRQAPLAELARYVQRNYYVLLLPVAVVLAGTLGYHLIEGMGFFDSFYMTCITITTVGFKEVTELSRAGKLFTILMIFLGLTTVAITATRLGEDIVTAAIQNQRMRMEHAVNRLRNHYILCGYGRMGRVIAAQLEHARAPFVVVDNSPAIVAELQEERRLAVQGDATTDEVLENAGVRHARGLVSVLSKESDNVFVVLSARELNPNLFILVRANTEDAVPKLYRAGASKVINPYESAGARIAQTLLRPVVCDFMEIFSNDGGMSISIEEIEVQPGSSVSGKSLRESDIRKRTNAIVVAIKKVGTTDMRFNPSGDEKVEPGDILIAIAELDSLNALADMARS